MTLKRSLYAAAVILVVVLAAGVRLYAAQRLNVDYDEPVYLGAAVDYARSMRSGDLKMLAWSENTYEHPALYKIIYGVALLTQPPLDKLPENDLPRLAPIAATEAGRWNVAARYVSVLWGTLAVLLLAFVNPLAGLFLAINTLSVKYTSEVYLEALPLLSSLLCAYAYGRWYAGVRGAPASHSRFLPWLILSAMCLGISVASKYVYGVVGLAIVIHWTVAVYWNQVAPRTVRQIAGWAILSLLMFYAFNPYLWPHPVERLAKSLLFHEEFLDSRLVQMYHYPFWQPVRWLSAFSAFYDLNPSSAFLLNVDALLFVLAIVGLPRLFQRQSIYFCWLAVGLTFLLVWTTKWPQYTLIVLAPFSLSAAQGVFTLWDLARGMVVRSRT